MIMRKPDTYAVIHKDNKVRESSRSGGIFTALSDFILESNGVIYGCVLTEGYQAVHYRAQSVEERNKMRGSKYIQSKMGNTYLNVKTDLCAGRLVLFSGTSCQVAGLKSFLGKEYINLLTVDIVCHGVPSSKVWIKYLKWLERKYDSSVVRVNFRNKIDFGWRAHKETIEFENGKKYHSDIFRTLFYNHLILRPSCYECHYKNLQHPGDITIADYWGVEDNAPEFDDDKGVSLVLINTNKGKGLFDSIKDKIYFKKTCLENSLQPPLVTNFSCPANRDSFWKDFSTRSFRYVVSKYCKPTLLTKIKYKLKKLYRK